MPVSVTTYPPRQISWSGEDARLLNWAGNTRLAPAGAVLTPADEDELRSYLRTESTRVRVIGSRMSAGRMLAAHADGGVLVDLHRLRGALGWTERTATFAGATPLQEVYDELSSRGRMLPASPGVIAEQTLAGALATGTHGQGLGQSSVADAAESIRMVLADGSVAEFDRADPRFPAVLLGLGCLGVTTAVTLRTRPSVVYTCRKRAVSAATLTTDLVAWNEADPLVKVWWFPQEDQVQVWSAAPAQADDIRAYRAAGGELLAHVGTGTHMNATVDRTLRDLREDVRVPIGSAADDNRPLRTVARFRDFTDVTGDIYQVFCRGIATPQINVEIGVPLTRAAAVIQRLQQWYASDRPRMHYPVILRCTGGSDAWLSPTQGTPTCYFGFVVYYAADGSLSAQGQDFLRSVERVVAAEGGRPHWGKYFDHALYDWPSLYPRWADFRRVRDELDPGHRFQNSFTRELLA